MPAQTSPTWLLTATRRHGSHGDLRISDAERAEVADLLSKHYGDGRLDQAEFNQRLDQAMKAKTYSELGGLFNDLPRTEASEAPEAAKALRAVAQQRHGHLAQRALVLGLVIAIAIIAGHVVAAFVTPWLWVGLLVVILVYVARGPRGRP
jgi:hypothetical protein